MTPPKDERPFAERYREGLRLLDGRDPLEWGVEGGASDPILRRPAFGGHFADDECGHLCLPTDTVEVRHRAGCDCYGPTMPRVRPVTPEHAPADTEPAVAPRVLEHAA